MAISERVAWLRQPEYTGENRCLPCTAVNAVIAVALAGVVAVAVPLAPTPSAAVAGCVLVGAGAAIYLRGYLVPGTPELTKRYLPDWFLRYFDHHEPTVPTGGSLDPVVVLERAGAVTECEDVDDLCLTDGFRTAWDANIERVREADTTRDDLADILAVPAEALSFEDHDGAFAALVDKDYLDNQPIAGQLRVGQWESSGAFVADMAAARTLAEWDDGWDDLEAGLRGQVLNGLRIFLETCPSCGDAVEFANETVESCCVSAEVVVGRCTGCGDRLFEAENRAG